ncbi:MAG: NAD(P)-dependent oxidoreductase [Phycisphaerales bacterium]|nr:NAD(P)-dependent oxidoreductase [Phycisphaerales bacterium]
MNIAITGATGFLGRYIANRLTSGNKLRCWHRTDSDRSGFDNPAAIEWQAGALEDDATYEPLCRGVDAVVHSALYRPAGLGFRASGQKAFDEFIRVNLLGTLRLMDTAKRLGVPRFVFISTCAVHEVILPDRPLDETHPLWPMAHYGAHKAAIEKFVHSYGFGENWPVCALRPTGIYGVAQPAKNSRWFDIVSKVVRGESFTSDRGGKEVHAADVAKAVEILIHADADTIRGQAYNCYDMYVAERRVAELARDLSGSGADISGTNKGPKNQIDTSKLKALGMGFGGEALLRETITKLVAAAK